MKLNKLKKKVKKNSFGLVLLTMLIAGILYTNPLTQLSYSPICKDTFGEDGRTVISMQECRSDEEYKVEGYTRCCINTYIGPTNCGIPGTSVPANTDVLDFCCFGGVICSDGLICGGGPGQIVDCPDDPEPPIDNLYFEWRHVGCEGLNVLIEGRLMNNGISVTDWELTLPKNCDLLDYDSRTHVPYCKTSAKGLVVKDSDNLFNDMSSSFCGIRLKETETTTTTRSTSTTLKSSPTTTTQKQITTTSTTTSTTTTTIQCRVSSDCESDGDRCVSNRCVDNKVCRVDDHCDDGYECKDKVCTKKIKEEDVPVAVIITVVIALIAVGLMVRNKK